MQQRQFHWDFIPPNSPHFGGLWEAGVKSLKIHCQKFDLMDSDMSKV